MFHTYFSHLVCSVCGERHDPRIAHNTCRSGVRGGNFGVDLLGERAHIGVRIASAETVRRSSDPESDQGKRRVGRGGDGRRRRESDHGGGTRRGILFLSRRCDHGCSHEGAGEAKSDRPGGYGPAVEYGGGSEISGDDYSIKLPNIPNAPNSKQRPNPKWPNEVSGKRRNRWGTSPAESSAGFGVSCFPG